MKYCNLLTAYRKMHLETIHSLLYLHLYLELRYTRSRNNDNPSCQRWCWSLHSDWPHDWILFKRENREITSRYSFLFHPLQFHKFVCHHSRWIAQCTWVQCAYSMTLTMTAPIKISSIGNYKACVPFDFQYSFHSFSHTFALYLHSTNTTNLHGNSSLRRVVTTIIPFIVVIYFKYIFSSIRLIYQFDSFGF